MKYFVLILSLVFFSYNLSIADYSNKMTAQTKVKINQSSDYKKNGAEFLKTANLDYPYSVQNNILYIDLLVLINSEMAINQLYDLGCKIKVQSGKVLGIQAPADKIENLLKLESVVAVENSQRRKLSHDKSKALINAKEVTVDNDLTPTNIIGGEGVIVGIFDTGIDTEHPDFKTHNGTRILKLWDISDKSAGVGPEGFDYGREYSKSDIDNSPLPVFQKDYDGHGTHVAGTAAGNGSGHTDFAGIAYNSDLIIVKGTSQDDNDNFTDIDIISGCAYIFREAQQFEKPAVINLSLGTPIGSHDGKGLLPLALSEMVTSGNIIVAAAGNEGELEIHAGGKVKKGEIIEFPIFPINVCDIFEDFCPDIPNFFLTATDVWYSKDAIGELHLYAYKLGQTGLEVVKGWELSKDAAFENQPILDDNSNPVAFLSFAGTEEFPSNNSGNFMIQIHNGGMTSIKVDDYLWAIVAKIENDGSIDLWGGIPLPKSFPYMPVNGTRHFAGDNNMTIGSPADGDSIVSVASFVSKNSWVDKNQNTQNRGITIGSISDFSSIGPSRDGRIVPIISAPGQVIFSALSKDNEDIPDAAILEGDLYAGLSGTSMASPHVAGAVALMLQVNPNLQFYELIDILSKTAKKDNFTGPDRNNTYGFGKIDVQAAINYMLSGTSVKYVLANDVKVYPNPASEIITLEINDNIVSPNFRLFNVSGERITENLDYQFINSAGKSVVVLNVSSLPTGVYNADCVYDNKISKFRFVVNRK